MPSTLERLAAWYSHQCDGDWEHSFGITIESLDNPGWSVTIDLTDTCLAEEPFEEVTSDNNEARWLRCWKDGAAFQARCGPEMLEAALQTFLEWAEPRTSREGAG